MMCPFKEKILIGFPNGPQDAKSKEIGQQVEQIQNELAQLSMVEMTKKDLKIEMENDVMAGKRETLSQVSGH